MPVRLVHVKSRSATMADMGHYLAISSLSMVGKKCGYTFSKLRLAEHVETIFSWIKITIFTKFNIAQILFPNVALSNS